MTADLMEPAPEAALEPAREPDTEQLQVEHTVMHDAVLGALIGAVVCAGIWVVLVTIAMAGSDTAKWPMLLVGAGCGIFAGIFLGGWAGTLAGASKLEHHEQSILRQLPGHGPDN